MANPIIIDSCVFNKIVLKETDSHDAIAFFDSLGGQDIQLIVPPLFIYEVLAVTISQSVEGAETISFLNGFIQHNLKVVELSQDTLLHATKIAEQGHPKSGFPSFYDAVYHALAIEMNGMFLTSDHRHVSKTEKLGHVTLLRDWKSLIATPPQLKS